MSPESTPSSEGPSANDADDSRNAKLTAFFEKLIADADSHQNALNETYEKIRDLNMLNRVIVHRYQCKRGCQIAQVYSVGRFTMLVVRDYKYSPGMNLALSVPTARVKNTLDGNRHWPSHVFDVDQLAEWGGGTGAHVICRHYKGVLIGSTIRNDIQGITPGKSGRPTTLGAPKP